MIFVDLSSSKDYTAYIEVLIRADRTVQIERILTVPPRK